MEPISEKKDKKSVLSAYCGNKTTMYMTKPDHLKKLLTEQ